MTRRDIGWNYLWKVGKFSMCEWKVGNGSGEELASHELDEGMGRSKR